MSVKSSDNIRKPSTWQRTLGLLLWVAVSFAVAQAFLVLVAAVLVRLGVPLDTISNTMLQTVVAALVYLLTLGIVMGVPWMVRKSGTSKAELGLARLPSWLDIGLAPAGFIIYMLATFVLTTLVTLVVPSFDVSQVQDTGFGNITQRHEYYLAFITLVVVAPLAEEILFRGYLYGKVRKYVPIWLAILLVSALFGAVHGQWNVGIDVFALSLVLCGLREITGSIWAGVLLHMMKNGIAYYLLFINPSLLSTMGG